MPRETFLVIELSDPAGILDPALWVLEPEEVIKEPVPKSRAVLAAHYRIIRKFTRALPTQREGHPAVSYRLADSEETALNWATQIQTCIHKTLSASTTARAEQRGPRLQCAIAIVHRSPKTFGDRLPTTLSHLLPLRDKGPRETSSDGLEKRALEEIDRILDQATGGRIVCSGDVHTELRKARVYDYYGWQSAARRPVRHIPPWKRIRQSLRGVIKTPLERVKHGAPWECLYDDAQVLLNAPFERVFAAEIRDWIKPSREVRQIPSPIPFPERPHVDNALVGLALSGGGMRSGVFSVGVMQALADHDFLANVDYMSTVSGGGYAGSALSALTAEKLPYEGLERLGTGQENFPFTFPRPDGKGCQSSSQVHGNESPAVKHVRENAALYGTKPGLFDAKTWIIAGRYLTSTALLWALFLIPVVTLIGLGGIALHSGMEHTGSNVTDRLRDVAILLFLMFAGLLLLSLQPATAFVYQPSRFRAYGSAAVVSLLASAWIFSLFTTVSDVDRLWKDWYVAIAVFGPLLVFGTLLLLLSEERIKEFVHRAVRVSAFVVVAVALPLTAALIFGSVTTVSDIDRLWKDWHVRLGVLSPLVVFGGSAIVSNLTDEPSPKWLQDIVQRVAQVAPVAAGVLTLMLLASGGVYAFDWLVHADSSYLIAQVAAGVTAATGAIATVISLIKLWGMKQTQALAWRALLGFGGYAVLGFGIIVWYWFLRQEIETANGTSEVGLAGGAAASGGLVLITLFHPFGRGILNSLSLHRIYATMLAKTWVIAAQPAENERLNHLPRWTRVWSRDDIRMSHLREKAKAQPPTGPYHLICTTLNLPGSTSTKLLDRKADSFVIAPLQSGSALTRWIKTEDHDELNDLRLSQAAAISGAAIAPNAGEHTSRTFSIMATLVNARLGRWIRNPRPSQNATPAKWLTDTPLFLYWKEMFGLASHNDGQIYLSDGGHFENLGLYELFRRRCKYIIAVSADSGALSEPFDLGNIGNALRLARVDFGVEVDLGEFKPLMHDPKTGLVKTFYAAGELAYPSNEGSSHDTGVLILLKTGLCENDLTVDIAEYWKNDHPAFPYDSTLNQQYDQPIFESYRHLGYLAARAMCPHPEPPIPAGSTQKRFEAVVKAYREFLDRPEPSAG